MKKYVVTWFFYLRFYENQSTFEMLQNKGIFNNIWWENLFSRDIFGLTELNQLKASILKVEKFVTLPLHDVGFKKTKQEFLFEVDVDDKNYSLLYKTIKYI